MLEQVRKWLSGAFLICMIGLSLSVAASAQFETRGTFPLQAPPLLTAEPQCVKLGDFNHDGKLDSVVVDFGDSQIAVLLGNGDGTFRPPAYYSVGFEPKSVAIADFNRDGNLDLAVAGYGTTSGIISLLFGNGDGTFQPAIDLTLSAYPIFVAAADFNDDGIQDLVVSDSPYVSVLLGNGDGTFNAPIDNQLFSPIYPAALGVGDFNRDGRPDLVVVGQFFTSSEATILLGNGDGTFQLGSSYAIGAGPQAVAVADFRNIGVLDLAIGSYGVQVLLGNGDGTFQAPADYGNQGFTGSVDVADFNLDGKSDLAINLAVLSTSEVGVLLGKGDGTFMPVTTYTAGTTNSSLVAGDLNNDRQADLVVTDFSTNSAVVLLNTGVVSLSPTTPIGFSPQMLGTTSRLRNVTVTNTGTKALSISSVSTKPPFQLAGSTTCRKSMAPGAKCTLSLTFKPTVLGLQNGLLALSDSASTKPQVIEVSGTGTTLTVSPSQLNFGFQKVGTKSTPQTVTVTNTGTTAVHVTGVSIVDDPLYDYSQTNTCGTQIDPGASCTISIGFMPTTKGTRTGAAEIDGPGGAEWQGVSVTGVGD